MRSSTLVGVLVLGAALACAPYDSLSASPPPFLVCFAPGTDGAYMDEVYAQTGASERVAAFRTTSRWSRTATDGSGLSRGDPTTLTWAVVPDGTRTGSSTTSNLRSRLNTIYGSEATWIQHFESMFDRWEELTGVRYVMETADDGAAMPSSSGVLGVRADIRIGGHTIDGNSGVLAYNYYPNSGDMVIDTADSFYSSTSSNSLRLRNVLAHEHGHGLGINHVCPVNRTKIMEPTLTTSFDGPQHDDILAGQRLYGDRLEDNDSAAQATDLGELAAGTLTIEDVGLDGSGDDDFYVFDIEHTVLATVRLTPVGEQYLEGPQSGGCGPGTTTDSRDNLDMSVALIGSDGSTVIALADDTGAAGTERLTEVTLRRSSGPFHVRVSGSGTDDVQLYELRLDLEGEVGVPAAMADAAELDEDDSVTTDVLANDTGLEDTPISVTIAQQPTFGTATVTAEGVRYVPDADYAGDDSYSYTITDADAEQSTAQVTVQVHPVNDDPIARDDQARVVRGVGSRIAVLANDRDVDGDPLSIRITQAPTSGVASVPGDGTVYYQAAVDGAESDTFTITIDDGQGGSDSSEVAVEVLPNWRAADARLDSDGDHFPDDLEQGLGTDPDDAAFSPSIEPPGTVPGALDVARLALLLRRGDRARDEVRLTASFELPEGVDVDELTASVYVGGVTSTLTAIPRRKRARGDVLRARVQRIRGATEDDPERGRIVLRLRKGDFEPAWEDEGASLRPARGERKSAITIYLIVEGRAFEATVPIVARRAGRQMVWRGRRASAP